MSNINKDTASSNNIANENPQLQNNTSGNYFILFLFPYTGYDIRLNLNF